MFELIVFLIILTLVYLGGQWLSSSPVEGFDTQLTGTPLDKANTLIFPAGFLALDRRKMPLADSPDQFGTLWTRESELRPIRYPSFKPGKIHPVTFSDKSTQIVGPVHRPPCPLVGTGPHGPPDWTNLEKVWTGHEMNERPALIIKELESLCHCEDP